ncbi:MULTISPECIES: glycosyltransferase family 4 protein [Cobetia]|uniref:Glycosyltransferase family 4 protein n=1 Tax=Cobetia crustatorum TaxID=553385 RepID=A0A558HNN7_9GAMM|nr:MULTISPECIES: glycosyltransferase family 4 protein [Cobetia]TVU70754.1 glycosyltransferase family 4 protein [Cobetia crustatorum]
MPKRDAQPPTVMLVSNSSFFLYNFHRGVIEGLRDSGYRVICLAPADAHSQRLVDELKVEHRALGMEGKGTSLVGEGRSLLSLLMTLLKLKPRYVLNFTIKANVYSGLACRLLNIPYTNNVSGLGTAFLHDSWLFRRVRALYGFANRGARCVFFENRDDQALFMRLGLQKSTPSVVLPGAGIDPERFAFTPQPVGPPLTFVMVARLIADKGVREYVAAAERLHERYPQARFWLIGPSGISNRTAISDAEITQWRERGVLHYLGEQHDVRPFLAEANILVLPSYREGMPRTVLEAASMGRPAIVSDVPGCRSSVLPGTTGWLCEAGSTESLEQQLQACLELPHDALVMAGQAARARIEAEFDQKIVVRAYLGCLQHTLEQASRKSVLASA